MAQNKLDLDRDLTALICEVFLGDDFSIFVQEMMAEHPFLGQWHEKWERKFRQEKMVLR